MKLGDRIRLHIEKEPMFSDRKPEIIDGEFVIIALGSSLPHCFNTGSWSTGFSHFEYGEQQDGRPDIVRIGSVYVPTPDFLDRSNVENLYYDKKIVSWEILEDRTDYMIPGFENLEESLKKLTIRKSTRQIS